MASRSTVEERVAARVAADKAARAKRVALVAEDVARAHQDDAARRRARERQQLIVQEAIPALAAALKAVR